MTRVKKWILWKRRQQQLVALYIVARNLTGKYFAFSYHYIWENIYRYCIVCKKPNPKPVIVLTKEQRTMVFLKRGIFVPENARCCSLHVYKRGLTYEALEMIEPSKFDNLVLNDNDVKNLMVDFRLTINSTKSFDFDNPSSLDDDGYKTITGLSRG